MKCLEGAASKSLLAAWGVQFEKPGSLDFQCKQRLIQVECPQDATSMFHFAVRIAPWLPKNSERFVWVHDWSLYHSSQMTIIERIRTSYGDRRPLIESPGHLFDEASERENDLFAGMLFLIMAFDWSGYFIAKNGLNHISVFDTLVRFGCSTNEMAEELLKETNNLGIKTLWDTGALNGTGFEP